MTFSFEINPFLLQECPSPHILRHQNIKQSTIDQNSKIDTCNYKKALNIYFNLSELFSGRSKLMVPSFSHLVFKAWYGQF